jgi:sterol desaturase/sphingolipid hydroxylase (fatty acid hydroxylase superfamily)
MGMFYSPIFRDKDAEQDNPDWKAAMDRQTTLEAVLLALALAGVALIVFVPLAAIVLYATYVAVVAHDRG